jgi:hypothetical protein
MNKSIFYFTILYLLCALVGNVIATEQHTLILALEDYGEHLHGLELLPTGEIVTTGQQFPIGHFDDEQIGVSPDSRFVWCGATSGSGVTGLKQFAITSYGQLTETGRFIKGGGWNVKFTPNGQMILFNGPIYQAYPDGSVVSTANRYTTGAHISPRGDIDLNFGPNNFQVSKIDYTTYSVYSIQYVAPEGLASVRGAAYTPEGDYVAVTFGAEWSSIDIDIYPILDDGSLDTTHVQAFDIGVAGQIAISKDGRFLYISNGLNQFIAIFRQPTHGVFEDTGWRIPVNHIIWQMMVSPDGKFLVFQDHHILETFTIQDDGNLVATGYEFPFETTFGHGPMYFQFAYPPAPTEVDPLWQLYE